ncbi:MAG: PilN domain-containing protein [Phycisphaeraceae bacterium]|nr:PilN domain-containing protein [Phycisphaeraceae bacterium]
MTQRIDLMPESCRARLGRKRQIRFWIAMYTCTALVVIGGNSLFEINKRQVRSESAVIREQVALDAEQRLKADQLTDEIRRIERAIDRNARIAWPIDFSQIIAAIGELTPESVYLTKVAMTPRQERASSLRRAKDDKGPEPLPRTRLQIECSGVAPNDHEMAAMIANLESHPLFERIAVEHVKPTMIAGREVKEFGVTCEIDFFHRFEIEQPLAGAETDPGEAADSGEGGR